MGVPQLMELGFGALVAAWAIVLLGAAIRGFTGFGGSLIWVSGLTLLIEPAEAVPVIFCLEVTISAVLVRSVVEDVEWSSVGALLAGAVVGIPAGAVLLFVLDPAPMQAVVSLVVLVSAAALASGRQVRSSPSRPAILGVGVVSGVLTGATSAGGPPVIIFYLGSPAGIAAGRASMIAYFGLVDVVGIVVMVITGLLDRTALIRWAVFVPMMLVGAGLGERGFGFASEETVRRIAIGILALLAVGGLISLI